jgi:hypothetical protein
MIVDNDLLGFFRLMKYLDPDAIIPIVIEDDGTALVYEGDDIIEGKVLSAETIQKETQLIEASKPKRRSLG